MSRRQFTLPSRSADRPPDDTGCTVLHVDMDAFYASASLLSRPDLVGTPVIIGGGGNRGVVLSATYEARRFGVASAMPMSRARRLCPQATVIAPDHALYSQISAAVMATFDTITPIVEPLSLDEAFLDVAGSVRRLGNPARIGQLVRDTIHDEQGITCSVGVAPTKFVAKLASGLAKPDGLVVVPRDEVVSFVQQLPVGALWGVGDKTEETLLRLGLHTVADIAHTPLDTLRRALGESAGPHLHDLSWGRDPRGVEPVRRERSIGSDETFEFDIDDPVQIHRHLLKLSDRTAARVRSAGMLGRTVTVRVRFSDFTTITRSKTLRDPTDVSREIYETARSLYDALGLQRARIRLVGVRMEGLVDSAGAPIQGLLDEPDHGWREADRAVDRASARFGAGSVRPAALISDKDRDRRAPGRPSDPPATGR
ncbi:DNA polymerase IV [Phycicoccus sp. Root563]|uniref:DNA polymerase IV n=1 Tax=unclassified Phycicoccus TaxID=2637926 RepID=UPI00070333C3|nr:MULTISPECIES: DNA polymerase IV [unclassified Phycicoccus]KQU70308.1 DNA polymerase IV [Phycicoccus sp. Root101]KQZ88599.1 DNA polymerase IV [Phycicoccus sp. Root563]